MLDPFSINSQPQQHANIARHHLDPRNLFDSGILSMSNQYRPPISGARQQLPAPLDTPIFSGYFEWDLANLLNFDSVQGL